MKKTIAALLLTSLCLSPCAYAQATDFFTLGTIIKDKEHGLALMKANVGGVDTHILLHTASSPAILSADFAQRIGRYDSSTPHGDELFVLLKPPQDLPLILEHGTELSLRDVGVFKAKTLDPRFGAHLEKLNAGMLYNPNHLRCTDQDCIVVLDFLNHELLMLPVKSEDAAKNALRNRYATLRHTSAPYVQNDKEILYVSGVSINGQKPVTVVLDTHITFSHFMKSSLHSDIKLAKQASITSLGKPITVEITSPVPISINGTEIAVSALRLESATSLDKDMLRTGVDTGDIVAYEGSLGLDVLNQCAIAIHQTASTVHFYCKAPVKTAAR
jgi:hypothetical protein